MPASDKKRPVEVESPLGTPRFDLIAAANARPVEPIPRGISGWIGRGRSVREMITTRTRALSLIIIAGLATGTLGGIMMVNDRSSNDAAVSSSEDSERKGSLPGAESGVYGFLVNRDPVIRNRKSRKQTRSSAEPRAYRVAVIRY